MMTFSSDTLRRSWDILAIQTSHTTWPSCFSMSRNSLFFMEEQMFWRLSWACSFPLSTTSSFKDPAYPHGIKPKSLHWHGEKREQGLRAPHSIRTNRALPQQCWAQASRSATALGNSNKPISSTHFQAASSVCSQQHLLESQWFAHQNRNVLLEQLCFLFSQRHSLGNNCKMKCFTMTNLTFFLDQRKIVLILPCFGTVSKYCSAQCAYNHQILNLLISLTRSKIVSFHQILVKEKCINYSFHFTKKVSIDILLRPHIPIPQSKILKLWKEIDFIGKSSMYVKMLQTMKEKDSGQGKIKVWMCSMYLLNFGSWVCQSSCLLYWAVSRCQPKSKPLSETSNKIWMHVRIWPTFAVFSGNVNRSSHIPTSLADPLITVSLHTVSHPCHPAADRNNNTLTKMNLTRAIS